MLLRLVGFYTFHFHQPDTLNQTLAIRHHIAGQVAITVFALSVHVVFGMNWQHCRNMAFVGVTDSYEAYYQSVRRCWRFGQNKEVFVHIIASEAEGSVVANIKRKERDAQAMADELSAATGQAVKESVIGQQRIFNPYQRNEAMQLPSWLISEKTSWTSSNNNQAKTGTYTTATV